MIISPKYLTYLINVFGLNIKENFRGSKDVIVFVVWL